MDRNNAKLNRQLSKPLLHLEWADVIREAPAGGEMLELGVWEGRSFTEICRCAYPRKVYGFDWFRGLPEDWDFPGSERTGDMAGNPPACPVNGEYVIGLVRGTLPEFVDSHPPAAFVHFDMDLYSSTATALQYLKFQSGAILAFDEIDDHVRNVNHEQKAFREWLLRTDVDFELIGSRHPESWVVRLLTAPL
jgi:hypothetical protein